MTSSNKANDESDKIIQSAQITSKFYVEQILGSGAFATVYAARYRHSSSSSSPSNSSQACSSFPDSNKVVALKLVNVSGVLNRRRNRYRDDDCATKNRAKDDNNCEDGTVTASDARAEEEMDTQQLFFPSQIVRNDPKKVHNRNSKTIQSKDYQKNQQQKREREEEERKTLMETLHRETSVHLSASSSSSISQKHPNIVTMLDSFQFTTNLSNGTNWVVAMVMEYCPRGDLHSYLKKRRIARRRDVVAIDNVTAHNPDTASTDYDDDYDTHAERHSTLLSEEEARHALRHVLQGLAFLHSRGIVHRDIKAGNILLSPAPSFPSSIHRHKPVSYLSNYHNKDPVNGEEGKEEKKECEYTLLDCTLKIGDFGLAVQMSEDDDWDDGQHTLCGTPSCLAPEVALSTPKPTWKRRSQNGKSTATTRNISNEVELKKDYNECSVDDCSVRDSILSTSSLFQGIKGEYGDDSILGLPSPLDNDGRNPHRGHGQPADLWSAGCLFYAMLVGQYPFSSPRAVNSCSKRQVVGEDKPGNSPHKGQHQSVLPTKAARVQDTLSRVVQGKWSIPAHVKVTDDAMSLLKQLLSFDPKNRGFARGLLSTHPFFLVTNSSLSKQRERRYKQSSRRQFKSLDGDNAINIGKENLPIDEKPSVKSLKSQSKTNKESNCSKHSSDIKPKALQLYSRKLISDVPSSRVYTRGVQHVNGTMSSRVSSRTVEKDCVYSKVDKTQISAPLVKSLTKNTETIGSFPTRVSVPVSSHDRNNKNMEVTKSVCDESNQTQPRVIFGPLNYRQQGENGYERRVDDNLTQNRSLGDLSYDRCHIKNHNLKRKPILLARINNIHRLPPTKYQWKQVHQAKNGTREKISRYYTIFILSRAIGAVIQCEEDDGRGAWMHVTADGTGVSTGKLSLMPKSSNLQDFKSFGQTDSSTNDLLIFEAFRRRPKAVKYPQNSTQEAEIYQNDHQSMCYSEIMSNALLSSDVRSMYSLPTLRSSSKTNSSHKPLSSLLIKKKRPFLLLYRKLEHFVRKLKEKTPKVTLYLHSCEVADTVTLQETSNKKHSPDIGGLICKAMLMENGPRPTVEIAFVDGVTIKIETSTGSERVIISDEDAYKQQRNLHVLTNRKDEKSYAEISKRCSYHLKLARTAVEKCQITEHFYEAPKSTTSGCISASSQKESNLTGCTQFIFPVTKKYVIKGKSFNDWIDVTKINTSSRNSDSTLYRSKLQIDIRDKKSASENEEENNLEKYLIGESSEASSLDLIGDSAM